MESLKESTSMILHDDMPIQRLILSLFRNKFDMSQSMYDVTKTKIIRNYKKSA